MDPVWTVGLMTGTVLDGYIDVALLKTDGETIAEFGPYALVPYPDDINAMLEQTLAIANDWSFKGPEPELFAKVEDALTLAQSAAVRQVVIEAGMTMDQIAAVGFHGQTVLHRAPTPKRNGVTRQLGNGNLMASFLDTDVVYDFRSADMAAGGQGAPLAAIYHAALLQGLNAPTSTAVLNLGGVANITWRGPDDTLVAFDTGPANAPINDYMKSIGQGVMDVDGALAAQGTVDEALLAHRMVLPYLSQAYPKSLDRFDFGFDWIAGLSPQDGAATLTAFSAAAVGKALDLLPERPTRLIVCGGGRRNPTLMQQVALRTGVKIELAEDHGWRGDAIEAECFGFLAMRVLRGMPISFPTTTGVPSPMIGGKVAKGQVPA